MYCIVLSYVVFIIINVNNIYSVVLGVFYNYFVRFVELINVYLEFVIFFINLVVCKLVFLL